LAGEWVSATISKTIDCGLSLSEVIRVVWSRDWHWACESVDITSIIVSESVSSDRSSSVTTKLVTSDCKRSRRSWDKSWCRQLSWASCLLWNLNTATLGSNSITLCVHCDNLAANIVSLWKGEWRSHKLANTHSASSYSIKNIGKLRRI
jgi:hypothetical protein